MITTRQSQRVVLSVHPKWAALIRSGHKSIELRRKFPTYLTGTLAYLYETQPSYKISGIVKIGDIHHRPICEIWEIHGKASCVEPIQFAEYFQNRQTGFAIEVSDHQRLEKDWALFELQQAVSFTVPQSWSYASPPLVNLIGHLR